jgi:hypothetical protein
VQATAADIAAAVAGSGDRTVDCKNGNIHWFHAPGQRVSVLDLFTRHYRNGRSPIFETDIHPVLSWY